MRPANRKTKLPRHILKSSASMYESSRSRFFRTTSGIPSGPDLFDESRLFMTYWTNLRVTQILCILTLLIEICESSIDFSFLEVIDSLLY